VQLTCTTWVESLNTHDDSRGGGHTDPVKNIGLCHCMTVFFNTGSYLLGVFYIEVIVKLTQSSNHTEHYRKCAISHARS